MGTYRDIALIFLGLQALGIGLVPLAVLGGICYAVFKYQPIDRIREGLRKLLKYLQMGHDYVERGANAVARPFIWIRSTFRMVQTIMNHLTARRNV